METRREAPTARHVVLHAAVATVAVTAMPMLAVWGLESAGWIDSTLVSLLLGVALSGAATTLGSALWMRHPGSRDLVFADLMIWGLVRRVRTDRFLRDMGGSLGTPRRAGPGRHAGPEGRLQTLKKLSSALEHRDPYTHGHTRRVARHSYMIAKAMKLPSSQAQLIRTAAAVHDVGKVDVPLEVLTKPGRLTDDERALLERHAARGGDLIAKVGNPELTALVRHHHERLDGRGYPDGLRGDEIPLGARIIAVADTFDAITSTRAYRAAAKHKDAAQTLRKESGTQLDPAAVSAFLKYYSGRNSVAWWASVTTAPQRLLERLIALVRDAAPSGLAGTSAAAGTAVLVTGAALTPGAVLGTGARPALAADASPSRESAAGLLPPSRVSQGTRRQHPVTTPAPGRDGAKKRTRPPLERDSSSGGGASPEAAGGGGQGSPSRKAPEGDVSPGPGGGASPPDQGPPGASDGPGDRDDDDPAAGGGHPESPSDPPRTEEPPRGVVGDVTGTVSDAVGRGSDTVSDAVRGGADSVSDAVDRGSDSVSDAVGDGRRTVSDADGVVDRLAKDDGDTESTGTVMPDVP